MPSNKIMQLQLGLAKQASCLRPFQAASSGAYLQLYRRPQTITSLSRGLTTSPRRYKSDYPLSILEQQRLRRPVSPHLTIYKWRYQSLTSIFQRFSGMILSGGLYVFGIGYLLAPSILPAAQGLFDIDSIVAYVSTLPAWAKISAKFALVLPFTYHAANGVKQLVFDSVRGLTSKPGIAKSSWLVGVVSLVAAIYLSF